MLQSALLPLPVHPTAVRPAAAAFVRPAAAATPVRPAPAAAIRPAAAVDPHCFDADPDPDPAQNLYPDPDPDPGGGGGRSAKNVHPPWQNPRYAPAYSRSKLRLTDLLIFLNSLLYYMYTVCAVYHVKSVSNLKLFNSFVITP
jgi:hypothetical protein